MCVIVSVCVCVCVCSVVSGVWWWCSHVISLYEFPLFRENYVVLRVRQYMGKANVL